MNKDLNYVKWYFKFHPVRATLEIVGFASMYFVPLLYILWRYYSLVAMLNK